MPPPPALELATAPLPVVRRPDLEFGVTSTTRIVLGAGALETVAAGAA